MFVEEGDGAAYLLTMIVPPKTYRSNEAPQPREAIFVIDTSRSMHGETMRQARDALLFGLERLTDKGRFNIISFSSKPRRLFTESWIADMPSLYCGHRQCTQRLFHARGGADRAPGLVTYLRYLTSAPLGLGIVRQT